MKSKALIAATGVLALFAVAGCTPEAREDVGDAGAKIGSATEKSVEGTAEATGKAVEKTGEAVANAGEAVAGAAQNAGEAVGGAVQNAGEAVGGAVKGVAEAGDKMGEKMELTPKVKNALVSSKEIDASTLNVDTKSEKNVVIVKGTQPTEAKKALVTKIAQKAVADAGSEFTTYKVKNMVTVAK